MSDPSFLRSNESRPRPLNEQEKQLVSILIDRVSGRRFPKAIVDSLEVCEMDDGGMGSLYFVHPEKERAGRRFGASIAEYEFSDVDGVAVVASLLVDEDGDLYELDVWKGDNTPTVCLRNSGANP